MQQYKAFNMQSEVVPRLVYLMLVVIATTFGNLLVIIAVAKFKKLRRSTNLMLASLAVADLLVGLITVPLYILWTVDPEVFDESGALCRLVLLSCLLFVAASQVSLLLLSLERYLAVCQPFKHRALILHCPWIHKAAICVIWVVSVGTTAASSLAIRSDYITCSYYGVFDKMFLFFAVLFGIFVLFLTMIVINIKVFCSVRAHEVRLSFVSNSENRQSSDFCHHDAIEQSLSRPSIRKACAGITALVNCDTETAGLLARKITGEDENDAAEIIVNSSNKGGLCYKEYDPIVCSYVDKKERATKENALSYVQKRYSLPYLCDPHNAWTRPALHDSRNLLEDSPAPPSVKLRQRRYSMPPVCHNIVVNENGNIPNNGQKTCDQQNSNEIPQIREENKSHSSYGVLHSGDNRRVRAFNSSPSWLLDTVAVSDKHTIEDFRRNSNGSQCEMTFKSMMSLRGIYSKLSSDNGHSPRRRNRKIGVCHQSNLELTRSWNEVKINIDNVHSNSQLAANEGKQGTDMKTSSRDNPNSKSSGIDELYRSSKQVFQNLQYLQLETTNLKATNGLHHKNENSQRHQYQLSCPSVYTVRPLYQSKLSPRYAYLSKDSSGDCNGSEISFFKEKRSLPYVSLSQDEDIPSQLYEYRVEKKTPKRKLFTIGKSPKSVRRYSKSHETLSQYSNEHSDLKTPLIMPTPSFTKSISSILEHVHVSTKKIFKKTSFLSKSSLQDLLQPSPKSDVFPRHNSPTLSSRQEKEEGGSIPQHTDADRPPPPFPPLPIVDEANTSEEKLSKRHAISIRITEPAGRSPYQNETANKNSDAPMVKLKARWSEISFPDRSRSSSRMSRQTYVSTKVARTVTLVCASFILSWIPFFVVIIYNTFCAECDLAYALNAVLMVAFGQSASNPIIYALCHASFRRAYKSLLTQLCSKRTICI